MLTKLQQLKEEREQGFTLIELLVVILIIGILSAIAIPAFLNQRKSAVDSSVQSDVSNAAKQVETWIIKQGSTSKPLPTGLSVTNSVVTVTDTVNTLALPANLVLKDIKSSDGTILTISGNSQSYTIAGTNTGGDVAVKGFTYNNTTGGLKPTP